MMLVPIWAYWIWAIFPRQGTRVPCPGKMDMGQLDYKQPGGLIVSKVTQVIYSLVDELFGPIGVMPTDATGL